MQMGYGKLYETKKTTPTHLDFCKAFISAWRYLIGSTPTKEQCCIVMAKFALETGFGKNCYNWNLGNIKKIYGDSHKDGYVQLKGVWEVVNGKKVYYPKEAPQSYFRNYFTLNDGMIGYLSLISGSKRYADAFKALVDGNPSKYSKELKKAGYYTGSEQQYTSAVVSSFNSFMQKSYYDEALSAVNEEIKNITPTNQNVNIQIKDKKVEEIFPQNNSNTNNIINSIFNFLATIAFPWIGAFLAKRKNQKN
jgi:hypothetical protein